MHRIATRIGSSVLILLCSTLWLSYDAIAQHPDSAALRASRIAEANAAAKSGDFTKAASIFTSLISEGNTDSAMYFSTGMALGLAGKKTEAVRFLDTASRKGWADLSIWNTMTTMLKIADDAVIVEAGTRVKTNAQNAPQRTQSAASTRIHQLYLQDQQDRANFIATEDTRSPRTEAVRKLRSADSLRIAQTYDLLRTKALRSGADFKDAALLLQHGRDSSDYKNANTCAMAALQLGDSSARFLAAATLDRYLVSLHKPQKYGTQSFMNTKTGDLELYPVDPSVTDAERAKWNVPALHDALKAARQVYGH